MGQMAHGGRQYEKRYVEVVVRYCLDGRCDPLTIVWDDGQRFQIDRIERSGRGRCLNTPGYAIRYDVRIGRRMKHLYHDEAGWFVEVREDGSFGDGCHPRDPRLADIPL